MSDDLALVLSGGGARAAYQAGVLQALAERVPALKFPIITGVSAGAINAVYLAAHRGTFHEAVMGLRGEWLRLTPDQVYQVRPINLGGAILRTIAALVTGSARSPAAVRGLMDVSPLRRFLESCVALDGIRRNVAAGKLRAVALSTTSYATGETVTFVEGQPDLPMWRRHMRYSVRAEITLDHVMASSAIPIIFPAVKLADGFYGDGSVRQTAPLAPAIHLGARRILAIGMRAVRERPPATPPDADYPAATQVIGLLLHSIFLDSLDADVERLERINQLLRHIPPEQRPKRLQPLDLMMIRPSRDLGAMAQDVEVRLPRSVNFVLRSMGGRRVQAADFLSYLLFEPEYTGAVMELGYQDAGRQWDTFAQLLTSSADPATAGGPR